MKKLQVFLGFILFIFLTSAVYADNRVEIDLAKSGLQPIPYDTIYIGGDYEIRIWIESDFDLGMMSIPMEMWSDNAVEWEFVAQPDGIGTLAAVTVVPGSRLDPPESAFDMTGLLVTEDFSDNDDRDSLLLGGVGIVEVLESGPLEHMISRHFKCTGPWIPNEILTLCFDTIINFPPGGTLVFCDVAGNAMGPEWGGQLCVPVKLLCGNPNGDNDVNVGDCVFMINHIFRDGPAPDPWQLGDANCDGTLDVGDVVFLIAASFRYGPQPECCE